MALEKIERQDSERWTMWHLAYLIAHKFKKFPDLSLFLSKSRDKDKAAGKKPVDGINEDAIMAWLVASKSANQEKKAKK